MTDLRQAHSSSRPAIAVVGALGFDRIHTADGRLFHEMGGSAVYAAIAAAFLARPVLLSRIGRDFSTQNRQLLLDRGVDLRFLQNDEECDSFFWSATYSDQGNTRQTMAMNPGAFAGFRPHWPPDLRVDAIQLGSIPPPVQIELLRSFQIACPHEITDPPNATCPFAFDTFPHWIEDFRDEVHQLCAKAAVISLNEEETCLLAGQSDPLAAAGSLFHQFQPEIFLLKQGSRGVVCLSAEHPFHLGAATLDHPPEPTGAGDSFLGAFLSAWDRRHPDKGAALRTAVSFASAVAAAAVRQPGIQGLLSARRGDLHRLAAGLRPQCRLI